MAEPDWLDETELHAWRSFMLMHLQLSGSLSRDLAKSGELSFQDYLVLAALTDRPDDTMRAFELAHDLGWEKSRLSHHIARMTKRGLVCREACESDKRGSLICATDAGRAAIAAVAPAHVARVREQFIGLLTPKEVEMLADISNRVLANLNAKP